MTTEPTTPGWYSYSNGTDVMIFHLRELSEYFGGGRQWSVHFTNGDSDDCDWGYIEQALSVYQLVPLVPDLDGIDE